ncbi:hypothetical protein QTP88_011866 [Uroleucon formosanum]
MAETPCFFGLTTVRVGTRVVAYLQFWSQLFIVMLLILKYFNHWLDKNESPTITSENKTEATLTAMDYYSELDFDISIFSQLSGSLLIIYTSYYLRIATYTHNLIHINFWMILNSLNFLTSVAFIIFAAWRIGKPAIFLTGLIGCFAKTYKLYVVYQFYTDETLPVAVNDNQNLASNGVQSLPRNHATVETRTETVGANDHLRPTLDTRRFNPVESSLKKSKCFNVFAVVNILLFGAKRLYKHSPNVSKASTYFKRKMDNRPNDFVTSSTSELGSANDGDDNNMHLTIRADAIKVSFEN